MEQRYRRRCNRTNAKKLIKPLSRRTKQRHLCWIFFTFVSALLFVWFFRELCVQVTNLQEEEATNEWMDGWISGWMDEGTSGRIDGWTDDG